MARQTVVLHGDDSPVNQHLVVIPAEPLGGLEHPDDEAVNYGGPILVPLHALMTVALIALGWWHIEGSDGDRRQPGHSRT